jgi:hypothetical protein
LTPIKAATADCVQIVAIIREPTLAPVSHSSKIAERLLAHARLYREIAGKSWNEQTVEKLEQLAAECERAAADVGPDGDEDGQGH